MTEVQTDPNPLPGDLAVVVPAYNVGDKLPPVLQNLFKVARKIIVVNDGSTDGCVDCVDTQSITVLTFPKNRGKGHALVTGYHKALEDPQVNCVAVLDADGQHDPAELPRLHAEFKKRDADFVIGARTFDRSRVPFRSWLGNVLTVRALALFLGQRLPDTQSGYRLLSRRFLEDVLPTLRGGRYETEMELIGRAIRGGFAIESVPIRTIYVDNNATSHFRKVRDSYLIYRTLLKTALGRKRA